MSSIHPGRWLTTVPFAFCAITCSAGALLVGCGSEPIVFRDGPEKTAAPAATSEYALKVYVTDKNGRRLVKIPPLDRGEPRPGSGSGGTADEKDARGLISQRPGSRGAALGLSSRRLGIIDKGTGGTINTEEKDADYYGYSGWTLLMAAVDSCIKVAKSANADFEYYEQAAASAARTSVRALGTSRSTSSASSRSTLYPSGATTKRASRVQTPAGASVWSRDDLQASVSSGDSSPGPPGPPESR